MKQVTLIAAEMLLFLVSIYLIFKAPQDKILNLPLMALIWAILVAIIGWFLRKNSIYKEIRYSVSLILFIALFWLFT